MGTKGVREKETDTKGFDTDRMIFKDDELSYCLGKQGSTRKKLEGASGAVLEWAFAFAQSSHNIATLPTRECTYSGRATRRQQQHFCAQSSLLGKRLPVCVAAC